MNFTFNRKNTIILSGVILLLLLSAYFFLNSTVPTCTSVDSFETIKTIKANQSEVPEPRSNQLIRVYENISYNSPREDVLTLVVPDDPREYANAGSPLNKSSKPAAPVFIFFHGGGWFSGDQAQIYQYSNFFVRRGIMMITVDYRLFDGVQNSFPIPVEDAACSLLWVKNHVAEYGGDPNHIVLGGFSAGGYIATMLAYSPQQKWLNSCSQKGTLPRVDGVISSSGVYDLDAIPQDLRADAWDNAGVRNLLVGITGKADFINGIRSDRWDSLEPINYVTPNAPPALLIAGGKDAHFENNTFAFAKKLRNCGVIHKTVLITGGDHGAPIAEFRSNSELRQETNNFLNTTLKWKLAK